MSNKKCESVAASELSRMNREKNKGWFEDKDPLTDKAPVHQEVALQNEFKKQGFKDATKITPHQEDIISVRFNIEKNDRSKFNEVTKEFMKENKVEVETVEKGDNITVKLPVENLEDYVDYLGDEEFKLDSEEEEQVEAILEKDDAKITKTDKKEEENAVDDRRSNATARSERKEDD